MRALIFTLGLLLTLSASAQLEKAEAAFAAHHYPEAIRYYKQFLKRGEAEGAALNLATAYWKTGDVAQAEHWFSRAVHKADTPEAHRQYAQLLMANGRYQRASEALLSYAVTTTDTHASTQASAMAEFCSQLASGQRPPAGCVVSEVNFNSTSLDFSPLFMGDTLVFVSNRPGAITREGQRDPWTQARFTDLFAAVPDTAGIADDVFLFAKNVATPLHEGPAAYYPGREELLVTTSVPNTGKRHSGHISNLQIVHYHKTATGDWSAPQPFAFHDTDYSMAHPAISPSGDRLVFAADYPNGFGGMDLWYSERTPEGNWTDPINLGPEINTPGEEVFPVIQPDGTLHFSSDFRLGYGGLDIYRARRHQDGWANPTNAGHPLNGSSDDFGLVLTADGRRGYFSSDRTGGNDNLFHANFDVFTRVEGVVSNTETSEGLPMARIEVTGQDGTTEVFYSNEQGLFEVQLPPSGTFTLQAKHPKFTVADGHPNSEQVVADRLPLGTAHNVNFGLSPKGNSVSSDATICGIVTGPEGTPVPGATVRIENRETGTIYDTATDARGHFYQPVQANLAYIIQAGAPGFNLMNTRVTLGEAREDCHSVVIALQNAVDLQALLKRPQVISTGMQLELYHVYFDRGEAYLRPSDLPELKKLRDLMLEYPSMECQLQAHTDARSTDAFNLELSQRRAEAAVDWLVENGVPAERLTARGYGELYLMNRCADGVACGELEHERNRRVEFRVIAFDRDAEVRSREKAIYKASTANR